MNEWMDGLTNERMNIERWVDCLTTEVI